MSSKKRILLLLILHSLLFAFHSTAQSRFKRFLTKADSILTDRYYHTSYDTNYVVRPEGKLTLKLKGDQTGNGIRAKGTVHDLNFKSHLSTSYKTTISIAGTYRGLSASYSINPAKLAGFYEDYELNINYYASRFCIDASYQRSSSLSGNMTLGENSFRMESGEADMKVFNITGYYVFNHRRYSVSAAYNQSYIQRRSAGSWLAG